jgi:hypothetical protein
LETTRQKVQELKEEIIETAAAVNDYLSPERLYKYQLQEARSCSPNTSTSPLAPAAWLSIDNARATGFSGKRGRCIH